jgi:hypothetical protein
MMLRIRVLLATCCVCFSIALRSIPIDSERPAEYETLSLERSLKHLQDPFREVPDESVVFAKGPGVFAIPNVGAPGSVAEPYKFGSYFTSPANA